MFIRGVWQKITTSGRTREIHAAQRECALREEFERRVHGLEAQILLLRAENRALLNSVLGIAGIPPIMVTDPAELPFGVVATGGRADMWDCEVAAVGVGGQEPKQIPRTASRAPENREKSNSARDFDRDDSFRNDGCPHNGTTLLQTASAENVSSEARPPNGAASPSTGAGHSVDSTTLTVSPVPPRKQRGRGSKDGRIVAPMRRRSWHQIYRMLELESTRRKDNET